MYQSSPIYREAAELRSVYREAAELSSRSELRSPDLTERSSAGQRPVRSVRLPELRSVRSGSSPRLTSVRSVSLY